MFDTWNEASVEDTNMGRGEFEVAETIRVGYKLSPVMSLSLTNTIVHSWGTTADNRKVFSIEDPYVMLAHSKLLGTLPSGLKSKGYIRLYPGVSESSRNKGQMAFLRGQFNLGRELGKVVSVAWETQPRYYFQSYKTYDTKEIVSDDGTLIKGSSEKANMQARIKQFGNVSLNLSSKFSAYQNLGFDYVWMHSDPEASNSANRDVPRAEYLFAETGVGYSLNDNLSFTAGIYSELARNMLAQTNQFSIYRADESLYFLEGTVTF